MNATFAACSTSPTRTAADCSSSAATRCSSSSPGEEHADPRLRCRATACAGPCGRSGGRGPRRAGDSCGCTSASTADVFHFFLVGESHRELLVTGPGATRTVEMESTSEAGEILVSAETAAVCRERIFGDEKEGGRLLRSPLGSLGAIEQPPPDLEGIDLEPASRRRSAASLLEVGPFEVGAPAGRRSRSCASPGSTISSRGGPRRGCRRALDALVRAIQQAADEHGVTFLESDVDRDGGRIILVAGAPQTFGDDEERILRTLARGRRPRPAAARSHRGQPRPRFHRPGRRDVPAHLHDPRRHRRARRAADGAAGAGPVLARRTVLERRRALRRPTSSSRSRSRARAEPVAARTSSARICGAAGGDARAASGRCRSSTANASAPCSTRRSHRCAWASARSSS